MGFRRWVARKFYLGVPVITGRLGLPFPLIPHPTKVTIVSGLPISLGPPNDEPTAAQLAEALEKYEAELIRLFDKYKATALPPAVAAKGFRVTWRGENE